MHSTLNENFVDTTKKLLKNRYLAFPVVHCEIAHYEKSLISVFQEFFGSIDKISFWEEDCALDYNFTGFWDFPDIS